MRIFAGIKKAYRADYMHISRNAQISVFRQRMATRRQIWAVFAVRTAFLLKLLQHPESRGKDN